jgi:hypothetical protein
MLIQKIIHKVVRIPPTSWLLADILIKKHNKNIKLYAPNNKKGKYSRALYLEGL